VLADFPLRYRVLRYHSREDELTAENQQEGFLIYFAFCRREQWVAPNLSQKCTIVQCIGNVIFCFIPNLKRSRVQQA